MKILHLIPSLEIGGAERLAFDICNELSTRVDIEIKLITFSDINDFGNRLFICHVPASIQLSVFKKNKFDLTELQKEIELFQPDIIHSHLFLAEIVSRSCFYPNAQWFSHFHDNMPQLNRLKLSKIGSKSAITNYYEKRYLYKRYRINGGSQFIAISQDARQYASSVLPKHARIHYLKNAINYEAFYAPVKELDESQSIQLINVGSFQKKKNQQFLIEVLRLLLAREVQCELVFLGDGTEKERVRQKVIEYGLENKVFFKGNVSNVKEYLQQADIYVHSAYYEPFGLVLLEAMAAGLPVVCLNGGGNADIFQNGVNGFILEETSPELFAERIEELVNSQKMFAQLAHEGQQTAKKYGIGSYCDKLIGLYQESLLKRK